MVKEIVQGPLIFRKAEKAGPEDIQTAQDLADTLAANTDRCVGMAANMIGANKRIIAVLVFDRVTVMLNPVITKKSGGVYETLEGCLSLNGTRKTKRYNIIEVEFYDTQFKKHVLTYTGFIAQIIQHEIDHCDGIVI